MREFEIRLPDFHPSNDGSMTTEAVMHPVFEQHQEQRFDLDMFIATVPHIEVWNHLQNEKGEGINSFYGETREDIKRSGLEPVIRGAVGFNMSRKGSFLKNLRDLLLADTDLHDFGEANDWEMDLGVFESAYYRRVARQRAKEEDRPFAARDEDMTDDDFAYSASIMRADIEEYIANADEYNRNRKPGQKARKVVVLVESGAPNSLPKTGTYPIEVEGQDRNNTPLLNLLVHPRFGGYAKAAIMESNERVKSQMELHRGDTEHIVHAPELLFGSDISYIFTDKNGNKVDMLGLATKLKKEGRYKDLESLGEFIDSTRATPDATKTSKKRFNELMNELKEAGVVQFGKKATQATKERKFWEAYKKRLGPAADKLVTLHAEDFSGPKTLNYDYDLYNPVTRKYPFLLHVLSPALREEYIAEVA